MYTHLRILTRGVGAGEAGWAKAPSLLSLGGGQCPPTLHVLYYSRMDNVRFLNNINQDKYLLQSHM